VEYQRLLSTNKADSIYQVTDTADTMIQIK